MYLGVFRDDFYAPINVLPPASYTAITATSGVVAAANLVGASETFLGTSAAATLTTDSATNICAALVALGVPPVNGPLRPGTSWLLNIKNTYSGTLTITGGTGVSFAASGTNTVATGTIRTYIASVVTSTGVPALTLTSVAAGQTVTA